MLEIYACKRNAHSNWWHFIRAQFSKKLFELLSPLILNQLWYFSHWGIKTYCKTNTDNANCFWSPQIHWRILTLSTSFGERICFFFLFFLKCRNKRTFCAEYSLMRFQFVTSTSAFCNSKRAFFRHFSRICHSLSCHCFSLFDLTIISSYI